MSKALPILEYDPEKEAIIEPHHIVKPMSIPEHCVLCYFQDEIHKLHQKGVLSIVKKLKSEMGTHIVFTFKFKEKELILFNPGVGAPLAAAFFEEIIALGCRKFVACGSAGVLDEKISMGHLLVPTAAIRDEGTSYHYLPPGREVQATPAAVNAIEKILKQKKLEYLLTKTWTTDALYRETYDKFTKRKTEGCLTVDMEAAALFAVAEFRNVSIGQIFYGGDCLGGLQWNSRGWTKNSIIREKLIWLAAEACLQL